jgi:glycosyltransferase involved in cell wall biosynthesis
LKRIAIVGPVYPYRAGIAYCTTRLAEELARTDDVSIVSFKRQYPKRFYPGGEDIDETLRAKTPAGARFELDVVNPITWLRTALKIRRARPDAVILVWWIWVWALPYRLILACLPRGTRVILQCHNIGDKEPAWWKRALTNSVLRRADALVVHAKTEAAEARRRIAPGSADVPVRIDLASSPDRDRGIGDPAGRDVRRLRTRTSALRVPQIVTTYLPVHELGGAVPSRADARRSLGITSDKVALFFGHLRPFKALDVALRAWAKLHTEDALLLVAGEAWWNSAEEYRQLATELGLGVDDLRAPTPEPRRRRGRAAAFDFRFIPDAEIATYFAAADVVLAPYRIEAQSGVALTAFHFARPVIATTVGGLPEIIEEGKNGYLVPPDDAGALGGAIDRFFARDDRGVMDTAAREAASRYSWSEYARVFERLLEA